MPTYTPNTDFSAKDDLETGDPQKLIVGADFDAEFEEIANAIADCADKNNSSQTGTSTVENITVTGDITVAEGGLVVGSTTVTATGDELNNTTGSTANIQDQLDALSANSGSAANVVPHRYWRLKFTSTAGVLTIREIKFWTNGSGFSNGLRWSPGVLVDNATISPTVSTGPDSAGGTLGSAANLVDGTDSSGTFTKSGGGDGTVDIQFDFDDDPQAISSMQLVMTTTTDSMSGFEILFSDDNSTWTSTGTMDASAWTAAIVAGTPSPHLGVVTPGATTSSDYAVFSSTVETIPPVSGGGGGGGFSNYSIVSVNTACVADTYYLLDTGSASRIEFTLPSSPSVGDRVGIQNFSADLQPQIFLNGSSYRGMALSLGGGWMVSDATVDNVYPNAVELTYVGGTIGWVNTFGRLIELPS